MPRYYFHLTDGKQVLNNHKGIDLPGNAAAREDAVALARDLKQAWSCRAGTGVVGSLSSSTSTDTRSTRCRSRMPEQITLHPGLAEKVCHKSSTRL